MDGSGNSDVVAVGLTEPRAICLDPDQGYVSFSLRKENWLLNGDIMIVLRYLLYVQKFKILEFKM